MFTQIKNYWKNYKLYPLKYQKQDIEYIYAMMQKLFGLKMFLMIIILSI
jgi:hypothetical protein